MHIDDMKDDLICPLLLAAGFPFKSIEAVLEGKEKS
jgi:hypothetical protein